MVKAEVGRSAAMFPGYFFFWSTAATHLARGVVTS
jgi:hypothetical protein